MDSIKTIFKIGRGPSSSHTMGPFNISKKFYQCLVENKIEYDSIKVVLLGSLALTGKGHLTDAAIIEALGENKVEIIFDKDKTHNYHPNAMILEAVNGDSQIVKKWEAFSVGGGEIEIFEIKENEKITPIETKEKKKSIYTFFYMRDILEYLNIKGKTFWEYVEDFEGKEIWDYLDKVWNTMKESIERGLNNEGVLPGELGLQRKASSYYIKANAYSGFLKNETLLFSYALAVAEENASGGIVSTAPTCGSSGVLPATLYFLKKEFDLPRPKILKALATAGLIGKIVETNASISGAEVGCQGEIGVACSMAAAAAAQLLGGTPRQIEYAAEMGLEHHLGLTCDPLGGYVQIPCIERNAFAASRAYDAAVYAILSDGIHKISFDAIVDAMKMTGDDLPHIYKETSLGGIAVVCKK